jgi:hypothetical protein
MPKDQNKKRTAKTNKPKLTAKEKKLKKLAKKHRTRPPDLCPRRSITGPSRRLGRSGGPAALFIPRGVPR